MRKHDPRDDVKVEDIPGRAQNMSKAERHESPGYFGSTAIRLERLKDRLSEGPRKLESWFGVR